MNDWREAKRQAEEDDAAGEVAAWLIVFFTLSFCVGLLLQ